MNFGIGKIIESIGKMVGLVIVADWRAVHLVEERLLARLLRYLEVDCVFDVGANIGQYGKMLRDTAGYRGRIISFEPNPAAFAVLEQSAKRDPGWHVEGFALGTTTGTTEFHAYRRSEFGSFRNFAAKHTLAAMPSETVNVPVQTLESYFVEAKQRWGFKRPFLKLDTQGFDLEVAKGAGKLLNEFVGLQSEITFQPIYDGAPDYLTALNYYQSHNFVISGLAPINENSFPELDELDAIMVRADFMKRK